MSRAKVDKAFETQELRTKYTSMGHKVLSDQGFSFFQKLSWIVAYKICPFLGESLRPQSEFSEPLEYVEVEQWAPLEI